MNSKDLADTLAKIDQNEGFQWILDHLPFGISVQTLDRKILYENSAVKELVGSYIYRHCFNRWHYLEGKGDEPCSDCPATIGFEDKKTHKIFRKTQNEEGNDLYLEIQFIPVFEENGEIEQFIEIVRNVSLLDKAKVLAYTPIEEITRSVQSSFVKFGDLGGEIISTDNLDFAKNENLEDIIVKLTVYIFSGVIQGFEDQTGLFGPFPVLDKTDYLMETFLFRIKDPEAKDPRLKGMQPCMILIFFPREYYFIFEKRNIIEEFIQKKIEDWDNLQEINELTHSDFSNELKKLLREQI
jgi:hypothetical protein